MTASSPSHAAPAVPDHNIAMELVRVTEGAAIAAARHLGRGDKIAVDQAAVDAMRKMLSKVDLDGIVIIGEGEKDEAPMLFNGERVGAGRGKIAGTRSRLGDVALVQHLRRGRAASHG